MKRQRRVVNERLYYITKICKCLYVGSGVASFLFCVEYVTLVDMFDRLLHKHLRIPYALNTHEFQSPKKPVATFVFIHGIGNTLHSWDKVAELLPDNVRAIGIDLLGFGESPKPKWAKYNAKTQARSVAVTLLKLGLPQRPVVVGHSLGALVAVEVAKRYPFLPKRLVLCGPPFYNQQEEARRLLKSHDGILRDMFRAVQRRPDQLLRLAPAAVKLGIANPALMVNKDNVAAYMNALESSIISQTSLDDVQKIRPPTTIVYGNMDAFVIGANITRAAAQNPNITVKRFMAGHEIVGPYVKKLAKYLSEL